MAVIQATAVNGGTTELQPEAIAALRAQLWGPVLAAGDPGYDESRTEWNAMIDRRPALVVRALGTADVIACVNFARDRGLVLTIKGGGHNIAGLAVSDGGLLLDLSGMRGVWVDERAKLAPRRRDACWVTWIARRSCTGWPRCLDSSATRASRASPSAAASAISRAAMAGPRTTCAPCRSGSFHDDASTATAPGPGRWPGGAYDDIDDVRVEFAPPTEQDCCTSDNSCSMEFPGECTLLGGPPAGPGTTCTPNPCGPTKARVSTWGAMKASYR